MQRYNVEVYPKIQYNQDNTMEKMEERGNKRDKDCDM